MCRTFATINSDYNQIQILYLPTIFSFGKLDSHIPIFHRVSKTNHLTGNPYKLSVSLHELTCAKVIHQPWSGIETVVIDMIDFTQTYLNDFKNASRHFSLDSIREN